MIDDVIIEGVNETKFLDVITDHKICCKPLITYVRAKLARSIGVLGKARHILDHKTLYCTALWYYHI